MAAGSVHRWINDGGERHPLENTLALLAGGLGLVSLVSVLLGRYDAGAWLGAGGCMVAVYVEFISKTHGERRVILVGFVLGLIGLAVSMSHGAVF